MNQELDIQLVEHRINKKIAKLIQSIAELQHEVRKLKKAPPPKPPASKPIPREISRLNPFKDHQDLVLEFIREHTPGKFPVSELLEEFKSIHRSADLMTQSTFTKLAKREKTRLKRDGRKMNFLTIPVQERDQTFFREEG